MYYLYDFCLDGTCHFALMHKYPIQIIVVWKELITSGGVLKYPILKKGLFGRNLSFLGECLSILYQKNVIWKKLITFGGVLKHPILKKFVQKELITSRGVLKHPISKNGCSDRNYRSRGSV